MRASVSMVNMYSIFTKWIQQPGRMHPLFHLHKKQLSSASLVRYLPLSLDVKIVPKHTSTTFHKKLFSSSCIQYLPHNRKLLRHPGTSFQVWAYNTKCVRFFSLLKQSFVSDLCQDIDVEEVKEKCRQVSLKTGVTLSVKDAVAQEMEKRFARAIENFSAPEAKFLKVVKLEHSFLYSEGYAIPSPEELSTQHWLEAMTYGSMEDRLQYYVFMKRLWGKAVDSSGDSDVAVSAREDCEGNRHSIFYDSVDPELEIRWANHRLCHAMQHGTPVVIDMDYVLETCPYGLAHLSKQLWDMYCGNRSSADPFHLVFTNCHPSSVVYRHLLLHHMVESTFILATFTEESHLDLFPLQDMVYLSAQSKKALPKYNPDSVYILGAYYDPLVKKKASQARARQHQISCYRLPIDENVRWRHQAGKDLDMDRVLQVLLVAKETRSWKQALLAAVPDLINMKTRS